MSAVVLEDQELAGRAARLLADVGSQVDDDRAVLVPEVAGAARHFALAEGTWTPQRQRL